MSLTPTGCVRSYSSLPGFFYYYYFLSFFAVLFVVRPCATVRDGLYSGQCVCVLACRCTATGSTGTERNQYDSYRHRRSGALG